MNISDYIVKEENRNERRKITVLFPSCVTIQTWAWNCLVPEISAPPTFGEIFDEISSNSYLEDLKRTWGENYEEAFVNVEITVQTENAGYKYLCNFRDKVFEELKDEEVSSLGEEERKREEFRVKDASARKVLIRKQIARSILILFLGGGWLLIFMLNREFAKQIALLPLISVILTGLVMIRDKIRFEDGLY